MKKQRFKEGKFAIKPPTHYAYFVEVFVNDYYDFVDGPVHQDVDAVMHTMVHRLVNNRYAFLYKSMYANQPTPLLLEE